MKSPALLAIFFTLIFISFLTAQEKDYIPGHFHYEDEIADDPQIKIPLATRLKSAPYFFQNASITTTQVNVDPAGMNIIGDAANEPSLAVDPTNPDRMVIGWRQFESIESNFRQAGIATSIDQGVSWNYMEPLESALFRSDPVLDTDSEGNFYYNSLNTDFECAVFKSADLQDWSEKVYAIGGDKQWMVVDKTGLNSNGNIYAFWKAQFSACTEGSFTRSTDGGGSYETCSEVPDNPTRGTLALDAQGDLYACGGWFDTFKVLKSTTAKDPTAAVDWDINTIVDLKGTLALYAGPNPTGMLGQVWIAADQSGDFTEGNVYLLSTVERFDNNDPADIMFARSINGGNNWSEAVKINDDSSTENWQWFGTLSVAPDGRIDVVWVDTRDNPGTFLSALYYSYSQDGGLSWSVNDRISDFFDPHLGWPEQQKIGDYYHMISTDEGAHLAWAATFNGEQDVFYSFIPAPVESNVDDIAAASFIDIQIAPNPVATQTNISFSVPQSAYLIIEVVDLMGKKITVLAQGEFVSGKHQLDWTPPAGLAAGMYLLNIKSTNGRKFSRKLVVK